jgi:hypothetical protein
VPVSPTPALTAAELTVLHGAKRSTISAALDGISITGDGDWKPAPNPYFENCLEELKSDGKTVPPGKLVQFTEYMAASAFVHAGDGWGYLGRALDALMNGDIHAAVHLIYYAELRAALALLSSEGIYVGDRVSLAVTGAGVRTIVTSSTHRAAWQCLDGWLRSNRAADLLGAVVAPATTPLSTWIDAMPAGGTRPVISDLLASLTLDLNVFASDRERRNSASYSPNRLIVNDLSVADALSLVDDVWSALEPNSPGGFPVVDLQLLIEIMKARYLSTEPGEIDPQKWSAWIAQSTPTQHLGTSVQDELNVAPFGHSSFALINSVLQGTVRVGGPGALIQDMIARTILLLRFATGSYVELVRESQIGNGDLENWISKLGTSRGFIDFSNPPEDRLDLWQDVLLSKSAIDATVRTASNFVAAQTVKEQGITLAQAERVVAWSL